MARQGQFKPGQSGNPAGKPKGTTDKRTDYRELFKPHAPELIAKAIRMALDGDSTAMRLCLERVVGPIKAQLPAVRIEGMPDTLTGQGEAVLRAMAAGDISPDAAADILQGIAAQARITEVDELQRRIEALEEKANGH